MSFKDELTTTVNSFRKNIKTEAINYFIDRLKTSMRWSAERGETTGRISLAINLNDDVEDEYVVLRRLNDLLLIEEVKRTKDFEGTKIYEWLLKQIHKTGIFDGICIVINDNYEMEYFWEDGQDDDEE
jgi:hypothetical protein